MTQHQKHAKLAKPYAGKFHHNEIAVLGTPCGNIKQLSYQIIKQLKGTMRVAYVDADHQSADTDDVDPNTSLSYGAYSEYVDKINFHRFDTHQLFNDYSNRQLFAYNDLVMVNGNHFQAEKQIVVIDPKKNLEKKLHKLTNVKLILFAENTMEIPSYLSEHIRNISEIPLLKIDDAQQISEWIKNDYTRQLPKINGLVLAGGKSVRMRRDKSTIDYHGSPQRDHMYQLLQKLTHETYISIRHDQQGVAENGISSISDTFIGLGPYGAILSAFRMDPNAAWLITACDQPYLDEATLTTLIRARNRSKVATCFYNPETDFPEPLITIWEPRAYGVLLNFLSLGYSCPRKILINSDIEMIRLEDDLPLRNVNTPEEYVEAMKLLGKSAH